MPPLPGNGENLAAALPGMQRLRIGEDDGKETAVIETTESLEMCRHCKGSGWLGTCGRYNLLCESCLGAGLMWIKRCGNISS